MDGATKGEFYIRKNERKKKKLRAAVWFYYWCWWCACKLVLYSSVHLFGLSDNSHSTIPNISTYSLIFLSFLWISSCMQHFILLLIFYILSCKQINQCWSIFCRWFVFWIIHLFVSLHVFVNCNRQTSKVFPSKQCSKQCGSTTILHVASFMWIILIATECFGTTGSAPGKGAIGKGDGPNSWKR